MKKCLGKTFLALIILIFAIPFVQSYADSYQGDDRYLMKAKTAKMSEEINFGDRTYRIQSVEKAAHRDVYGNQMKKMVKADKDTVLLRVSYCKTGKEKQDEIFITDTTFKKRYAPLKDTGDELFFMVPKEKKLVLCVTTGSAKDTKYNRVLEFDGK